MASIKFHPVLLLPDDYDVLDFTGPDTKSAPRRSAYSVGRYNEKRFAMYTQELFGGQRDNHVGIDLGGPAGTAVHAFSDAELLLFADNDRPGDYGPTLVLKHRVDGRDLYALYGHLSRASLQGKCVGQRFAAGEVIGSLGDVPENGGWPPHVHFQISYVAPKLADMPGAVSDADLPAALALYPDPRLVLGPLY